MLAFAVTRLRSLVPSNPRLALYLGALGDLRGTGAPFSVVLGIDPKTGIDRGSAQFATGGYVLPATASERYSGALHVGAANGLGRVVLAAACVHNLRRQVD